VDLIIPGGWFLMEHPMSFEGNDIQVKQYHCNPESIISYDETILDEEEAVWVGSLTVTQALKTEQIKEIVLEEYHDYLKLFGEPLAQELPPHRMFNHQIRIKEAKEVPFGLIYHLSEIELGAL
jgi:hypothetical protein